MTLKDKIIAGIAAAGLAAGASVIGLDQACVFDAEILNVAEVKICFKTEQDYKVFKIDKIAKYNQKTPLFLWTQEGTEFMALVNHEMEKLKNRKAEIKDFSKDKNLLDEIVTQISSNP